MLKISFNKYGFTLIELLVSMAISGVVMAGIYSVYSSQQRSYMAQEQIAFLQQNLRSAMHFMEREIRLAGCDPTGRAKAGIISALPNSIRIAMDITGGEDDDKDNDGDHSVDEDDEARLADGDTDDPNEDITYSLYLSGGIKKLGRKKPSSNNQPVAENIDALDFVYLDKNGNPTTMLSRITSVQITLVARTGRRDPNHVDTKSYLNQQGDEILSPQNDNYHRRMLAKQVKCRNLTF